MIYTLKKSVPLGGNNEAEWIVGHGLAITDIKNYECVVLSEKEVVALIALIALPVTDEQITELLKKLDTIAREYDRDFWGLPYLNKKLGRIMCEAVRDWLTTPNQTHIPTKDK